MTAQDTPSGTRMMWVASVNAICARAQGTGSMPPDAASTMSVDVTVVPLLCAPAGAARAER